MGVEAASNLPVSRTSGNTFRDQGGNLWLFGGFSYLPAPMYIFFNDLWKFNPATNNWTWMKGSFLPNAAGNYGVKGVPAAANTPGARSDAASWVDSEGNFWLFGGEGRDGIGAEGMLNDLWKYQINTNTWVWVSGTNFRNAIGMYGVQGVPAPGNVPGGRSGMACWADNLGHLWIYGGFNNLYEPMNDLWRYHIATNTWTWIKGSAASGQPPVYGTRSIPGASNTPGGRGFSAAWIDASNHLYLFGGTGLSNLHNDLWKYSPENQEWTWIHGDNQPAEIPFMGTQGVAHPQNKPGARVSASAFTDLQGNFWMYGGYGVSTGGTGGLADLWRYTPATNQWTWMKGGELNANGVYGTQGLPAAANTPGSKWNAMSWSAPSAEFWMFGGMGYGESPDWGEMNDLWSINSTSLLVALGAVTAAQREAITVYPNPARGHITFDWPQPGSVKASYAIIDAGGRTMMQGNWETAGANRYSIDVAGLPPGTYILSVKTKKETRQASFVKQQ